ncbi:MAG: saccharopine dehydrogenase family protein [Gaiellaceae bacterium]
MRVPSPRIAVVGATGHTGRVVISELRRRGLTAILVGRDAARLNALAEFEPGEDARVASINAPASLDQALAGAAVVINCAGPFLETAAPVIEASLRAGIHYLDVTAEQAAALDAFERGADAGRAHIVVAPSMAFYGALADLLATAAMGDWESADAIRIGIALDSWKPTPGTRLTGARNTARRLVYADGALEPLPKPPPQRTWEFPAPFGTQEVVALPFTEVVLIARHLQTSAIHSYINLRPIADLRDPDTPPPAAADESGRSDQIFLVDAIVQRGSHRRRATAGGRDIYAVTAPIVVEATERILDGRATKRGALAAGELFDAQDFLQALDPQHLSLELENRVA